MNTKDNSKIINSIITEVSSTYVLIDDTKLGETFDSLPSGLINKTETGMGATTLELKAERNSIIVEPIKITASSKAFNQSKKGNEVLYVGTSTNYHPDKIQELDILKYISNPQIPYKKITVVADSLPRVIKAIGEDNLKDYFLMIDEADSFQLDSVFRRSMEDCLDIYKKFPKDKRCLLSATLLEFSDESLQDEHVTTFKYQNPKSRTIDLIKTGKSSLHGTAIDKIIQLVSTYPHDKIMIAFNSVNGCFDIAEKLRIDGVISESEISILCSKGSAVKAGNYYKELISDVLPGKINFITSAYFTGFDLHERYHLVSISGNRNRYHALSNKRLKQIAGRCRSNDGLLSETIIHDLVPLHSQLILYTKEELIETAETEIRALKCLDHQFRANPILKFIHQDVNDLILDSLERFNSKFIRKQMNENYLISYLNVDASLHVTKTALELYTSWDALTLDLKDSGHKVRDKFSQSKTIVNTQNVSKAIKSSDIKKAVTILRTVNTFSDINEILESGDLTSIQRTIIEHYGRLYGFIENTFLLDEIEKFADKSTKELNNFISSAHFNIASPTSLIKSRFLIKFPIGSVFTRDEIVKRITTIYAEHNSTPSKPLTQTKALQRLNAFFKTQKNKVTKEFTILSENPLNIPVLKVDDDVDNKTFFMYLARRI